MAAIRLFFARWWSMLPALLLLAVWPVPARAQGRNAPADVALSHQAWSTEEGLPDASVSAILQSQDGYLWLATEGGVARFDGQGFRSFRHENEPAFSSNDVRALAQDTAGALWFGTADGLLRLQGGTWRRFAESDGLPSATVTGLEAAQDGSLWVLTSGGPCRLQAERCGREASGSPEVQALEAAADGRVLLLTAAGELRTPEGQLVRRLEAPELGGPALEVRPGPEGAVWVRSVRAVSFQGAAGTRVIRAGTELGGSRVTAFLPDSGGRCWVGTNRGLFMWEPHSGAGPHPITSLGAEAVLSLAWDREGNLWVGTEGAGLHALRPRKFQAEAASAGRATTAVAVSARGTLWFGTREEGVFRVEGDRAVPVAAGQLTSPVVLSLAAGAREDLWVGTPDGLNHIQGSTVETFTSANGLPDDFVRSVVVERSGVVWAGTRRGLARLESGSVRGFTRAEGLRSESIGPLLLTPAGASSGAAARTPEELWVGTSAGLAHLRGDRLAMLAGAGPGGIVTALASGPEGSLWAAIHGHGLARVQGGRLVPLAAPALPAEINAMQADGQGFLWLRDARHVYRLGFTALGGCAQQPGICSLQPESFGSADGLPADALAAEGSPEIARGGDGRMFFVTRKGLAVADPAHLPANRVPPPVVLQRFSVDGAEQTLGDEHLEIGPGHGRYTFDFAALSYTLPSRNRYRYRLWGFDRDWVEAGTGRSASYTSLPPRRYEFAVEAQNNDGVWSSAPARVRFRVLPAFYRRWWFALLVVFAVAGCVFAVLRLRERAIRRRFALILSERNRMAREIHDTLAQDLVSVSLQLDLASSLLSQKQIQPAREQLKATRTLVRRGLEDARQSIWNLRANTAVDSLPTRLQALVDQGRSDTLSVRLKMGGAFRALPRGVEDEVLRVAGECLSNVRRHAEASEAFVQLHYETDRLQLTVRDDGQGFDPAAARTLDGHYGLRGMEERAEALGGSLRVESSPGEGAAVSLLVPLTGVQGARVP